MYGIRLSKRILVIAEKPSSSRRIAVALDENSDPRRAQFGRVAFYVSVNDGDELVVVSAVGHMYTLTQVRGGWTYPVFDIKWVPSYEVDKGASYTKPYLDAILELGADVDEIVSACDYDQEGSLIAFNIIKLGLGEAALGKSRRMLFNTLTDDELVRSWMDRLDTLDFRAIASGKLRHEVDWLYGINVSRALTLSVDSERRTLSTGRVQGPALKFVYDRELLINWFVPYPYWRISAETVVDGESYPLNYSESRLEREVYAKKVAKDCRGKKGLIVGVDGVEEKQSPPAPFNLGDLQEEAYRVFKMEPSETLKIAEKLYLSAVISYPRTSSQRIPHSIDVKSLLTALGENSGYSDIVEELIGGERFKPHMGRKDDPAHPAIHPTGNMPVRLKSDEVKVYDLVVRRFFASLGKPLISSRMAVEVDVNDHLFFMNGKTTVDPGWSEFYGDYFKSGDVFLPDLRVGMVIPITKLSRRRYYSKPPKRFTSLSLIKKMEAVGIGTKATRSGIVEKLYRRDYVGGKKMSVSDLGSHVIEVLEKYCPSIIDVELTRGLEEELGGVLGGEVDPDDVLAEVVSVLESVLDGFGEAGLGDGGCRVCGGDVEDGVYCWRHQGAYRGLEEGFKVWRIGLGLGWVEFIEKIGRLSGSGVWVKEVVRDILSGL